MGGLAQDQMLQLPQAEARGQRQMLHRKRHSVRASVTQGLSSSEIRSLVHSSRT